MKIESSKARQEFAEVVSRVGYTGERAVITRHGKPIAAIVSVEDEKLLAEIEALEDAEDRAAIDQYLREGGAGQKLVPWENVKARLGL